MKIIIVFIDMSEKKSLFFLCGGVNCLALYIQKGVKNDPREDTVLLSAVLELFCGMKVNSNTWMRGH